MVKEGRCIIGGGGLLWWVKGDVLLWAWETYYCEQKVYYFVGGRLAMVKGGRCIITGCGDFCGE